MKYYFLGIATVFVVMVLWGIITTWWDCWGWRIWERLKEKIATSY